MLSGRALVLLVLASEQLTPVRTSSQGGNTWTSRRQTIVT